MWDFKQRLRRRYPSTEAIRERVDRRQEGSNRENEKFVAESAASSDADDSAAAEILWKQGRFNFFMRIFVIIK